MQLSEYPENTIIHEPLHGNLIKSSEEFWTPVTYHCIDCLADNSIRNDGIDQLLDGDYKIVSIPFGVAVVLAMALQEEFGETDSEGNEITVPGLLVDAFSDYTERLAREADHERAVNNWQYMESFENEYLEINELGQVRNEDEEIFSPEYIEDLGIKLTRIKSKDKARGKERNFSIDSAYFVKRHFNKELPRDA